jgi:hypothetical protein
VAGPPTVGKPTLQKPSNTGGGKQGGNNKGATAMAGPGVPLNSPLLQTGVPLVGQAAYDAAKAIADAQTAGPYAELARQIAADQQQTRRRS